MANYSILKIPGVRSLAPDLDNEFDGDRNPMFKLRNYYPSIIAIGFYWLRLMSETA